jgi:hypothetical protein
VRMELGKGFRKYQWERNGVIISGATSYAYTATNTGTYRARFSRVANPTSAQWNQWSEPITVTQQTPPKPVIEQTGTVLLKDLNYYNSARLNSATDAARYYWYKNGALVNLSGSADDTVSHAMFYAGSCTTTACAGNGKYTLITKTADGCPSPPSDPKYVYFNNTAPVNISAPGNFKGTISSLSSVKLTWSDASSNENGFEIWRRHKTGTTYSKWEMRTITRPNVVSFVDTRLSPSTTYHYKIRAAGNTGRSNYTPSASSQYLVVVTGADSSLPTAPQSLVAKPTAIGTIQLTWKAATDNTGIKQYKIYYSGKVVDTNSTSTAYTLTGLELNKSFSFTVKAQDLGGNIGPASNAASASTVVKGLYYEHATGSWTDLDQINWNALPEFKGTVNNFSLGPRTQEDFFNFEFDGYLYITKSGSYTFRTISSDGSRLQIGTAVVVNNDGVHGNRTITSAARSLNAGAHRINLKYFEYDGTQTLTVQYYGPDTGFKWITVPDAALRSGGTDTQIYAASTDSQAVSDTLDVSPLLTSLYPNPTTTENINLAIDTDSAEDIDIAIVDFTGRTVFHQRMRRDEVTSGVGVALHPESRLMKGVYLVIVKQGNSTIKQRLSIRE